MAAKVFISHASVDSWVARQIAAHIQACGAQTFLDESDIDHGDDFEEKILAVEPDCSELLVLLTPWAISRPYVMFEVSCFKHSRKRIVGVLHGLTVDDVAKAPHIGVLLRKLDLVDINGIESYFAQLRRRVLAEAGTG